MKVSLFLLALLAGCSSSEHLETDCAAIGGVVAQVPTVDDSGGVHPIAPVLVCDIGGGDQVDEKQPQFFPKEGVE